MSMPTRGSISLFAIDHCSERNAEFAVIHSFETLISPLTPAASLITPIRTSTDAHTFCINIEGMDETTAESTIHKTTIGMSTG